MGKIRMVAFDIDGTLLTSDDRILPSTLDAVEKARRRNVIVTLCTGRNYNFVTEILKTLGIEDMPIVSNNGAVVLDDKKTYVYHAVGLRPLQRVFSIAKETGIPAFGFNDRELIGARNEKTLERCEFWRGRSGGKKFPLEMVATILDSYEQIEDLLGANSCKMLLSPDTKEEFDYCMEHMTDLDEVRRTNCFQYDIDVFSTETSKGTAIRDLAKHYGIGMNEVMTFGDGENDMEMINVAGVGVAMGNGAPLLKKAADFIAPSNDDGGIMFAMRDFGVI